MSTSKTISFPGGVSFPKPFITAIKQDPLGVSETANLIINGGYFTTETTVTIAGQTINSITIEDDDQLLINITTGNTIGFFDVTVNNGTHYTLTNGLQIKNKTTLIPADDTTIWEKISSNVNTLLGKIVPAVTGSSWDKGASFGAVPAGSDFILTFNPSYMPGQSAGGYAMIGMDTIDPNHNYASIDYALYLQNGTNLYVFENGSGKGFLSTWQVTDVLSIKRTGTTIEYLQNGTVIYTSLTPSSSQLVFDTSLYRYLGAENISIIYFAP